MTMAQTVLDLGGGIKLTFERPFTVQYAIDKFKAAVEKAGGKVTQIHDELTVSGISLTKGHELGAKLTEDLSKITDKTQTPDVQIFSPFSWTNTPKYHGALSGHRVSAFSKKIATTAPLAMSTWEFSQAFLRRVHGKKVHVVGQHYQSKRAQKVIGYKKVGNMALLVAEPDNYVDLNAIMVLMWEDETNSWQHVGYVRATQAALLRSKWKGDHRHVMVARITAYPANADGHRDGRNIELTLTGEVRTYPGYSI